MQSLVLLYRNKGSGVSAVPSVCGSIAILSACSLHEVIVMVSIFSFFKEFDGVFPLAVVDCSAPKHEHVLERAPAKEILAVSSGFIFYSIIPPSFLN